MKAERYYHCCDKCGEPVPNNNDAVILDMLITGDWTLFFCQPRHLIPTDNCEGSPSRAQYIEGQPRDTRGYGYGALLESATRKAYARMQEPDFLKEFKENE